MIQGKRQGVARVNQFDDASIKRCVQSALAVCRVSVQDDKLEPLLDKQPEYANVDAFKKATVKSTPASRADAIGKVLREFEANKVEGAGIFDADQGAMAYSNSKGVFAYKANTKAEFSISAFLEHGEIEGWAEAFGLTSASSTSRIRPSAPCRKLSRACTLVLLSPANTRSCSKRQRWRS